MPMPYYVSPEQMMQDKAEYARKGIAKGRSIIAMEYVDGILLTADNPSASLHKVSEIYDNMRLRERASTASSRTFERRASVTPTLKGSCTAEKTSRAALWRTDILKAWGPYSVRK